MKMKSLLFLLFIIFLLPSNQQESCDRDHPFRLLTRMSGKALFASGSAVVLDFVESVSQTPNTDRWVLCTKNGVTYSKNTVTSVYLSYDPNTQSLVGSSEPIGGIEFDEWNSVPGYTLIKFIDTPKGNTLIVAYENDIMHLSEFSTTELWAQWNKQPLDPLGFRVVDDCDTAFLVQNKGSGLILSFGNAFPYDGFMIPHYGPKNWLVYNTCPYKIPEVDTRLWVLCNGRLRTKHPLPQDSPWGYYYITHDVIRIYSGFVQKFSDSDLLTSKPAYVDQTSSLGDNLIKLDVIDYNSGPTPQPATWFLYYNTNYGNCGGDAFARHLDANSDYFKWNFLDPNGQYNF